MKPLRIIALALSLLALAACTGNLSSRTARQQIAELGDASLLTDDIQVQRIVTELGGRSIVEANVQMAFQFERNADGAWTIVSARLGDREWIEIEDLLDAIEAQNTDQTTASLEKLALGVGAYRSRNGALPEVPREGTLSDVLHPVFMTDLVRDDAWGYRIRYAADRDGYELRAPGPDGAAGTGDDIVLNRPSP
jgi:hypothetical protein